MSQDRIDPDAINKESLRAIFENEGFAAKLDEEGDLEVIAGRPVFVLHRPDGRSVRLMTFFSFIEGASLMDKYAFLNRINAEVFVCRAYMPEDALHVLAFDYYVTVTEGTPVAIITTALRYFMDGTARALSIDGAEIVE